MPQLDQPSSAIREGAPSEHSTVGSSDTSSILTSQPALTTHHNLPVFAWLWAAFTLFDRGHEIAWTRTPLEAAEMAAAVAVLVGPTRIGRFLALAVLQTANLWWWMPELVNHTLFALIVDMTVIAAAVLHAIRQRGHFDPVIFYRSLAPAVRIGVVLLYTFAALAKFNTGFLDLSESCAVDHYMRLRARVAGIGLPLPAGGVTSMIMIASTLIVESAIPLLLAFARTRQVGIVVTMLFHYILALNGFYDFSAMAYALLLLFTPDHFSSVLHRLWVDSRLHRLILRVGDQAGGRTAIIPFAMMLAGVIVLVLVLSDNRWQRIFGLVYQVWLVYGALVIFVAIRALLLARRMPLAPLVRPLRGSGVLVAMPVLVLINGLCPYVGLKTETSFTMFANLRTEEGLANHLFMPSFHLFPYQWDLIQIESSSDGQLRRYAQRNELMSFYAFRDHLSRLAERGRQNVSVTFIRQGVRYTLESAERDRRFARPYPLLVRKVMMFRPVDTRDRVGCAH